MNSPIIREFEFNSLRRDWYSSNQTLPRLVGQAVHGFRQIIFIGFPRQWIPIFEWYGVRWRQSIAPQHYLPFFSDLSEPQLLNIIDRAKQAGVLRSLIESTTMLDPIISDFLYIVDNSVKASSPAMQNELAIASSKDIKRKTLMLNGWQSYGRPSIRLLEKAVEQTVSDARIAAALPCSYTRPYDRSHTHKQIYRILTEAGYDLNQVHLVVITSLGVLPQEVWTLPQVMKYDAGVPDIYRILRLARSFFSKANYDCVLDCLQFTPYSDVLTIAHREGAIKELRKIPVPKKRHFVISN
jgi:predicted RNA-binding protein